jgi:hypothetical protein
MDMTVALGLESVQVSTNMANLRNSSMSQIPIAVFGCQSWGKFANTMSSWAKFPWSDDLQEAHPMLQRRSGSAGAVLGNQLVLLGGNDGSQVRLRDDPSASGGFQDQWCKTLVKLCWRCFILSYRPKVWPKVTNFVKTFILLMFFLCFCSRIVVQTSWVSDWVHQLPCGSIDQLWDGRC